MRSPTIGLATVLFLSQTAAARPLLTEEPETLGRHTFEARFSISERNDAFNSPKTTYKTVNFPVQARLGLHQFFDTGFLMTYVSQRLETGSAAFSGSRTGMLSPLIKISPWKNLGVMSLWHVKSSEEGEQSLPVARGDDFEAIAMLRLTETWPSSFNVGYLFRSNYRSKLGVSTGPSIKIEPGDIFEAKAALEIPLKFHFSLLSELAYYNVQPKKIGSVPITGSSGDALDAVVGFTWALGGWNVGAGAAFGLLEESHTSFDLERGAGDVLYKFSAAYKLKPKRPEQ